MKPDDLQNAHTPMKTVVRVLTYTGPEVDVDRQLASSIPDGRRLGMRTVQISALTLTADAAYIVLQTPVRVGPEGIGYLRDRIAELPASSFIPAVSRSREEFDRARALDHELAAFCQVHRLTRGQRALIVVDQRAVSEADCRHLQARLWAEGIQTMVMRVQGDPATTVQVFPLPADVEVKT